MDRRVLVLALASFGMGTEAYVYVGHLQALADELAIPVARAGLLAAVFALAFALTAPLLAAWTAGLERRRLICGGLLAIAVLNAVASLAPSFAALLLLRLGCGLAAGLVGPAASAAAAALVPPERRGRALAVVLAGLTLAFVLGIPLGSVVGAMGGWRATFAFAAAIALVAAMAIAWVLPRVPGGARAGGAALALVARPDLAATLALTVVGFAATFTVIAYIGPLGWRLARLEGAGIGALQALIGVGSILGVAVGGRLADRAAPGRALEISSTASALALALYSVLALLDPEAPLTLLLLGLGMILGAAALFARTPIIQALLVAQAPDAATLALALNGSMVFLGQGLGALVGALTIGAAGLGALGAAGAGLALLGALIAAPAVAAPRRAPGQAPG